VFSSKQRRRRRKVGNTHECSRIIWSGGAHSEEGEAIEKGNNSACFVGVLDREIM